LALGEPDSRAAHRNGYTWGWDRLHVAKAHKKHVTGEGLAIGIPDTGIYANHSAVILKVKDFRKQMPSANLEKCYSFDDDGHGTHVAGTCAGETNSVHPADKTAIRIGGAPRADLYGVAVLQSRAGDQPAAGTWTGVLAAMDWLASEDHGVHVINLALGSVNLDEGRQALVSFVVEQTMQRGILVVAAAGNQGKGLMYPAALPNVVSCGALTPEGSVWDKSADYPMFVLPGVGVHSCVPHGMAKYLGQNYAWMSGTSMAAAHMSALCCLAMQRNPKARVDQFISAFLETASHSGARDRRLGWGVPDLFLACRKLGSPI
jgi:subtilisin family serine protease